MYNPLLTKKVKLRIILNSSHPVLILNKKSRAMGGFTDHNHEKHDFQLVTVEGGRGRGQTNEPYMSVNHLRSNTMFPLALGSSNSFFKILCVVFFFQPWLVMDEKDEKIEGCELPK